MLQVDAKAGVAHVELLQGQCQDADQASTEKPKEEKEVDATAEVATTADAATAPPASSPADSSTAQGASSRVFFLLKVRLSTPTIRYILLDGDPRHTVRPDWRTCSCGAPWGFHLS